MPPISQSASAGHYDRYDETVPACPFVPPRSAMAVTDTSETSAREAVSAQAGDVTGNGRDLPNEAGSARFKFMHSMCFSGPVVQELAHYHLRGSGVLDKIAGLGFEALSYGNNYDFVASALRDHEVATFWGGGKPFVYLRDAKDINAVSGKIELMTQSDRVNPENGTFGQLQAVFGEKNVLEIDMQSTVGGPRPYRQAKSIFDGTTGNKKKMDLLYTRDMNEIITTYLKAEAGKGARNLTDFTHKLAMDVGASLLLNARHIKPTDIIEDDPSVLALYRDLTPRYASNRPAWLGRATGCPVVDPRKDGNLIARSQMRLLEKNYPDVLMDTKSTLQRKWHTEAFFGTEKKPGALGYHEFPQSFEAFRQFMDQSETQYQACHALLRDQGFMQVVSSETTSQAMNFALRELLRQPKDVERIRKEIRELETCLDNPLDFDFVTPQTMVRLPFLSAFVIEILRRYPPSPLMRWMSKEPLTVAIQGIEVTLPPGTSVIFDVEMGNRHAVSSGDQFSPARFFDNPDFKFHDFLEKLKEGSATFRTFAGGPRVCPGREMAATELAKLIGFIARDWHLSTPEAGPVSVACGGPSTLRPIEEHRTILLKPAPK